jgi:hypothetical protein
MLQHTIPPGLLGTRAGIDLDLVEDNLPLPVKERRRRHEEALALLLKLGQTAARRDATFQPTAGKAR